MSEGIARSLFDLDLSRIPGYNRRCGLLFPGEDLDAAILRITASNRLTGCWDQQSLADLTAYYLFYPVLVALQFCDFATDFYPFRYCAPGVSRAGRETRPPTDVRVLHAGCASEESALAGYECLCEALGHGRIQSYDVVDLCTIPVNRVSEFAASGPFGDSAVVQAKVLEIAELEPCFRYDVVITDRLLGSSPRDEYDIAILRNFKRLLADGGMIVTTVEAAGRAVLGDRPQVPGEICFGYFCRRYGCTSEGRDAKLGLTLKQWSELSARYHKTMARTYFGTERQWRIRSAGDVLRLLRAAGIERSYMWKVQGTVPATFEDLSSPSVKDLDRIEGSLILCAVM